MCWGSLSVVAVGFVVFVGGDGGGGGDGVCCFCFGNSFNWL